MSLILRAARFADTAHAGQVRKYNGAPYILHPMRVAGIVSLLDDATESMVAAAWLHDVVEDCGVTIATIRSEFGEEVATLVAELTSDDAQLKLMGLNRHERKSLYVNRLRNSSREARNIKLIDRIDNLSDVPKGEPFFDTYLAESRHLLEVFRQTDVSPELLARLSEVLA